jgi:hypothetical protein
MCAAYSPDVGGLGARCGLPGHPVRRACVHEHVIDTCACDLHIEHAESGFCLACFEADGHECPITIVRLPEVAP